MTQLPHLRFSRFRNFRRFGLPGVLALLFIALFIGQHLVSGGDPSLEFNAPSALPPASGLVDQSPLRLARQLAPQAAVPQERQYAQDALRLADNEVDQAFASALRSATQHAPPLTGQALKTSQRLNTLNARIKAEQAEVATRQHGPGAADDDPQLQLAQAQLALDTDEADELHQTLIRLGGDRHAVIQQALDEHEAVHKEETGAAVSQTEALEAPAALRSLIGKFRALSSLRSRHQQLIEARNAAQSHAAQLLQQRNALSSETENAASPGAIGATTAETSDASTTTAHLRALAANRESLTAYERRIHDLESLADTYTKWDALVRAQERTITRRILRVFAFIVFIIVVTILIGRLLHRLLTSRTLLDRRRQQTLQFVLSFSVQLVGALLILIVIFGTPRQTPTVIGLTTAGLTVVLKDFIVAFFGWFILMGKNGVRVGDWVEINGVGGEVVEVGLLRTTLLETGNWSESGRPTGRRVAFMNSYAIEDHYFNFSTTGQWLWEELHVALPSGKDPYALCDAIRGAVQEITRDDVELASRDWRRLSQLHGSLTTISAQPTVELRPTGGLEVVIRYLTRAQDRFEMRSRLNQRLLGILHAPPQIVDVSTSPAEDAPQAASATTS
ncbi:MAG: mechanosensitive ion channel domain-containing protein [Acidobacteriaceae bacterium]